MLKPQDRNTLEQYLSELKKDFFFLISEFGADYQGRFFITKDNLKSIFNRVRITSPFLEDCINFIENQGFKAGLTPNGIELNIHAEMLSQNSNDLVNAIRTFRDRAYINGDYQNI